MAVYTMTDISAVIFILDQSFQGKKAGIIHALKYAVKNAVKVFHRKNILMAFIIFKYWSGIKLCKQHIYTRIYNGIYYR